MDILLAVLASLAQWITSYLGWRVTVDGVRPERRKLYEALFILGGIVGTIAIGLTAYRTNAVAVTQNHSHVDFVDPGILPRIPGQVLLPFRENEIPTINIGFAVFGPVLIKSDFTALRLFVRDAPIGDADIPNELALFKKAKADDYKLSTDNTMLPGPDGAYFPMTTDKPLTKEQAMALNTRHAALCVTGMTVWRDNTGRYETNVCQCLIVGIEPYSPWQTASCHNKETKLK
jgi:hypothetical protein